jgi:hypothetical protein
VLFEASRKVSRDFDQALRGKTVTTLFHPIKPKPGIMKAPGGEMFVRGSAHLRSSKGARNDKMENGRMRKGVTTVNPTENQKFRSCRQSKDQGAASSEFLLFSH